VPPRLLPTAADATELSNPTVRSVIVAATDEILRRNYPFLASRNALTREGEWCLWVRA